MRKAVFQDIAQLINICRQNFRQSLRWRANGKLARTWWESALGSTAVEVWCVVEGEKVLAFCVLTIDEIMWAKQKILRRGSNVDILFSSSLHPVVAYLEIKKYFIKLFNRHKKPITYHSLPTSCGLDMRTWLELIAVRHDEQGKGIGSRLLEYCELRTKELGRNAIALRVHSSNTLAKRLYERKEYMQCQTLNQSDLYVKVI